MWLLPQSGRDEHRPPKTQTAERAKLISSSPIRRRTSSECLNWELLDDSRPWRPETIGLQLLRKEVIQPHLPVRLPCYDFTPIANPTFGSSFPDGLGH